MKSVSVVLRYVVAFAAVSGSVLAAQSTPPDAQQLPAAPDLQAAQRPRTESAEELKKEEHQRLLGVLPTFNVVLGGVAPPLTPKQKFSLFLHTAIDPAQFVVTGLDAGIEQAQDQFPAYHYGFEGYVKRFAASYADSFDGNLFGNAILPSLLHQDPRYFRLGHGTFKRRLGYALASTVRCRGDNGHWQFAVSNIGGNLIGGAIANAYYPQENRGLGLTLQRGFIVTAEGSLGGLLDEFYPDAIAYLKRHHHK